MPLVTAFLNPCMSTVTEYWPRTSGGLVYAPALLVTMTVSTPVASLWIVTVAPGNARALCVGDHAADDRAVGTLCKEGSARADAEAETCGKNAEAYPVGPRH